MVDEMFDSGKDPHGCGSGERLIEYIYGEIDEAAKAQFEDHISTCVHCADELASFSALRLSMSDWKASGQVPDPSLASGDHSSAGLFTRISETLAFSFGWKALAGASVVVIVLLLGVLAFSILNSADPSDQIANSAPGGRQSEADDLKEATSVGKTEELAETKEAAPVPESELLPAPTLTEPESQRGLPVQRRESPRRKTVPPSQLADNNDLPRLSEAADEEFEDDSLRLTDLFTDIGED